MVVEDVRRGLPTKFHPFPVAGSRVMSVLSFSVVYTRPCPFVGLSVGRRGSRRRRGMKLGSVVEHVRRGLRTKFQPFPAAVSRVMSV